MAHEFTGTISSCAEDEFPVEATVAGRTVIAKVPGLVIEAQSHDGSMGHTYKLQPDDMDAAREEFAVGNTLTVTLTGSAPE